MNPIPAPLANTLDRLAKILADEADSSFSAWHRYADQCRVAASELRRLAAVETAAQRAEQWFSAVIAAERAELAIGVRDALRAALAATAQPTAEGDNV